jgi:hypothetical protein
MKVMDEKTLRTLIEAGSVKQMQIIGDGALFHVDVVTMKKGAVTALTSKGTVKTWSTLGATARWIRSLGIGKAQLDMVRWDTRQKGLRL